MPQKQIQPNRVDLDTAIQELRTEGPAPDLAERLTRGLRGRTPSIRPRVLIGGALVAACLVAFWPHGSEGVAWAQSQANTAKAVRTHQRWFFPDGKLRGESWTDGMRRADYTLDKDGAVAIEYRSDAKRTFFYSTNRYVKDTPNSERAGAIITNRFRAPTYSGMRQIDEFLKLQKAVVLSQKEEQTSEGSRTIYEVKTIESSRFPSKVVAETDTGKIREITQYDGSKTLIDYPDQIPDEVLDVTKPKAEGIKIYDAEVEKRQVATMMKKGFGTVKGVSLKAAVIDRYGTIWFLWTGWLPDGAMSRPVVLTGIPCSRPAGPKEFTSSYKPKNKEKARYPMMNGVRMGGMALTPRVKVGSTLKEVVIPGPHGKAVFHNIPLLRVSSLFDTGHL